ncbi:MAG: aldo/keto reductase [Spirochaetes bacterium]|nr:aldo/keto reductase [Spirochaetota bacterium]
MLTVTLGRTGADVTALGMGGMRFPKEMSDRDAADVVRFANECGVNYFDTAPGYCDDRSEAIYGKALSRMPTDNWRIATKGFNTKTGDEIAGAIENSLRKLKVDCIDFYFLWSVLTMKQYEMAKMKGRALEGILAAKKRGLIKHLAVSTHVTSDGIRTIVDDDIFDVIMAPYNVLNYGHRDEGLRYAKSRGLGTVAMNPLHGGVISEYRNVITVFGEGTDPVAEAMRFCLASPVIDVTLSGMHTRSHIDEHAALWKNVPEKISLQEQDEKNKALKASFSSLCTSCGYCVKSCPQAIFIPAYMEAYNSYLLTKQETAAASKLAWHHKFGLLVDRQERAAECIQCGACEKTCTQYLPIIDRLAMLTPHEKAWEAKK